MDGSTPALGVARVLAALIGGLAFASLPFVHYVHPGHDLVPHADHDPRHGGVLQMIGDHHVEVVRQRGRLEVFVSDATRGAVQAISARAVYQGRLQLELDRADHRLVAEDPAPETPFELTVELEPYDLVLTVDPSLAPADDECGENADAPPPIESRTAWCGQPGGGSDPGPARPTTWRRIGP